MSADPRSDPPLDDVLTAYLAAPEPQSEETPTVRLPFEAHLVACVSEAHEALYRVLGQLSEATLHDREGRQRVREGVWKARALLQEAETVLKASGEYPQVGSSRE